MPPARRTFDDKPIPLARFLTGASSWNAYELTDFEPDEIFSSSDIVKANQSSFSENYKWNVVIQPHPTLIFWELQLEEKHVPRTRGSPNRLPRFISIKFAVSVEYGLLFSKRNLTIKIRNALSEGFGCSEIKILSLNGSDPINLLMLYQQARIPDLLKLQYQEKENEMEDILNGKVFSEQQTEKDDGAKEIHLKLGCNHDEVPCINELTVDAKEVPIQTGNPKLKGYKLKEVKVKLAGGSVYHMYLHLAETGVITKIPEWVAKTRASGKTHCRVKFS